MAEHPANAVRKKKDSSIVVGCRLVKDILMKELNGVGTMWNLYIFNLGIKISDNFRKSIIMKGIIKNE